MNNYKLPDFIFPTLSINYNPKSKEIYNQYGKNVSLDQIKTLCDHNAFLILDLNRDHSNFLYGQTSAIDVYRFFTKLGINNIIFLTSESINDKPNIIFFPNWLYLKSLQYSQINLDTKNNRTYKLSCLNRFPSPHRVYFLYHLISKNYFDKCLTSFLGFKNPYNALNDIGEFNSIYDDLPIEIKQYFKQNKFTKQLGDDVLNIVSLHDPTHPAYTDSYLNVITESTYYNSFYTEKTAKALFGQQLFIMIGGANSIANLIDLGFQYFDPVISSSYDRISCWKQRIDCAVNLIDSIFDNIEEIYFHFEKEIKFNAEYFVSQSFRNKCLEPISHLLK